MSQLADLAETFRNFQVNYKWTDEQTVENFREVLDDLEWEVYWGDVPKTKDGETDYEAFDKLEEEEVRKCLYGEAKKFVPPSV